MVRTQTNKNDMDNRNKKNKTVSHLQPFLNRRFHPFFTVLTLTSGSPCKEDEDNRRLQPLFPNVLATFASAFAFEDKNNNNTEKKTKKKNEKKVVPPRDGVKTDILACFFCTYMYRSGLVFCSMPNYCHVLCSMTYFVFYIYI